MQVTFSPLTACKSLSANHKGAYRLFVLVKAMAKDAHANISDVQKEACQFISERQFARDMSEAIRLGLLTIHKRENNTRRVFAVVSHERAAVMFGASKSSAANRFIVSLADLFSDNWQAIAFTTWQAKVTQNGGRLISQKKQAEWTGISPRIQYEYNKACGVKSQSNYAVSNIAANRLDGEKEFGTRAAPFTFKDYKLNQMYIAWRLPSKRVACTNPSAVNAIGIEGSLISTSMNAPRSGSTLFIHDDETTFTKAKRRAAQKQRDLYVFSHVSKSGAGMYRHFAI